LGRRRVEWSTVSEEQHAKTNLLFAQKSCGRR
jgi:hypothetical protein